MFLAPKFSNTFYFSASVQIGFDCIPLFFGVISSSPKYLHSANAAESATSVGVAMTKASLDQVSIAGQIFLLYALMDTV